MNKNLINSSMTSASIAILLKHQHLPVNISLLTLLICSVLGSASVSAFTPEVIGETVTGETLSSGTQNVRDGGIANDTTINTSGVQNIYSGGLANGTIINGIGAQNIYSGGVAENTILNEFGSQSIYSGGIANNTTINSEIYQHVQSGGISNNTIINDKGKQYIDDGGIANDIIVNDEGYQNVMSGGISNNTILNDKGRQDISDGGVANTTTLNNNSAVYMKSGGILTGQTTVNDLGTIIAVDGSIQNNGELIFQRSEDYTLSFYLSGTGGLTLNSPHTLNFATASTYLGTTNVNGGVIKVSADNVLSANSDYITQTDSTLDLNGYNQTLKSLKNGGNVTFGGTGGSTLIITGDYIGINGLLNMNSVLGDDNSVTDKLIIGGNTSGNTFVQINNIGGSGAETLNGIELITVGGVSDGNFTQLGRIVAGAYDYSLARGVGTNATNWYLSSDVVTAPVDPTVPVDPSLMAERPEASGYAANLAAANNMFAMSLHDRLGETQYIDALTGEQKVTSLWLRNAGGHNRSRDTLGQLSTKANRYVVQLGGDIAQWSHGGQDRFHLGVMGGYANSKSRTGASLSGYSARASVDGYSTGVYGTWYANETDKSGLYVDSWAQYSWFNNTVDGQGLNTEEYKSKGWTASLESGYTFKVGENAAKNATYFIQPKAQVTWMGVKADDHKEVNGTRVSGEGDGNIQTRLGVKAFMNGYSEQDKGKDRVFQPFVEANWIHNTNDFGTTMNGVTIKQDGAANIGELKVGVEGQINKQVNLWGNVGQQIGNKGYSDTAVMLGVKYNF